MNNRRPAIISIVLLVAILAGAAGFVYVARKHTPASSAPVEYEVTQQVRGFLQELHEDIAEKERTLGPRDVDTLRAKLWEAKLLRDNGKTEEAENVARENISALEEVLKLDGRRTGFDAARTSETLEQMGRIAEAERFLRLSLASTEHIYGPEHRETCNRIENLAKKLAGWRRLDEAAELYHRAIRIREKDPKLSPSVLARNDTAVIEILKRQKKQDEAIATYRRAINRFGEVPGKDEANRNLQGLFLARYFVECNKTSEAISLLRELITRSEGVGGSKEGEYVAIKELLSKLEKQ